MKKEDKKLKFSKDQKFLLLIVIGLFIVICVLGVIVFYKCNNVRKVSITTDVETNTTVTCQSLCSKIMPTSNVSQISSLELEGGMYYGNLDQKKEGTPNDWIHVLEGTKSSAWRSPKSGRSYGCDCDKFQNKEIENIDVKIETGNKDKIDEAPNGSSK